MLPRSSDKGVFSKQGIISSYSPFYPLFSIPQSLASTVTDIWCFPVLTENLCALWLGFGYGEEFVANKNLKFIY